MVWKWQRTAGSSIAQATAAVTLQVEPAQLAWLQPPEAQALEKGTGTGKQERPAHLDSAVPRLVQNGSDILGHEVHAQHGNRAAQRSVGRSAHSVAAGGGCAVLTVGPAAAMPAGSPPRKPSDCKPAPLSEPPLPACALHTAHTCTHIHIVTDAHCHHPYPSPPPGSHVQPASAIFTARSAMTNESEMWMWGQRSAALDSTPCGPGLSMQECII